MKTKLRNFNPNPKKAPEHNDSLEITSPSPKRAEPQKNYHPLLHKTSDLSTGRSIAPISEEDSSGKSSSLKNSSGNSDSMGNQSFIKKETVQKILAENKISETTWKTYLEDKKNENSYPGIGLHVKQNVDEL
jgi:hypothetical protein